MNRTFYQITFYLVFIFSAYFLLKDGVEVGFIRRYISADLDIIYLDKIVHFALFFLLMALMNLAYPKNNYSNAIALIVYGMVIEIAQHFFTRTRTFDWWDWVADIVGIIVALLFPFRIIFSKILKLKN